MHRSSLGYRLRYLLHREQRGQSLVELALVLPLLVLLIIATSDIGMAMVTQITLTNASREGARLAARGNVFAPADVLRVVREHSRSLDLDAHGTVWLTVLQSNANDDGSCCSIIFSQQRLLGSAASRFTRDSLLALQQGLTPAVGGDPDAAYLRKEKLAVVEIVYDHSSITGFIHTPLTLYVYSMMPVSAPS
jgi:hypothetical protein